MTSSKGGWREISPRRIGQRATCSKDSFIIVTNAKKTEKNYLNGLKRSLPDERKNKVTIDVLPPVKNPQKFVERLVKRAQNLANISPQFNIHKWIVFDCDQDQFFFDEIIQNAENKGIYVAWSNPCIEVWFLAYFKQIPTDIGNSQMLCIDEFKRVFCNKTNNDYCKNDKMIYDRLKESGDENKAFERAEMMRKAFPEGTPPSKMGPSTKVDLLVKMILRK